MNKAKRIWESYGGWILLGLPIAMITIMAVVSFANKNILPVTAAEPPTETEITFDMEKNIAYTAEDGMIVIPASESTSPAEKAAVLKQISSVISDTANVAQSNQPQDTATYTLPELAQLPDGSIGLLSIPKLKLSVGVFETENEMEAMESGIAHFKTTSAWSGNIGLCGHNINFNLTDGHFKYLHTLKAGDVIHYKTALGERSYTVETVTEITETDWSYLGRTEDNRITMITCISGKPQSRLVVQAVQLS